MDTRPEGESASVTRRDETPARGAQSPKAAGSGPRRGAPILKCQGHRHDPARLRHSGPDLRCRRFDTGKPAVHREPVRLPPWRGAGGLRACPATQPRAARCRRPDHPLPSVGMPLHPEFRAGARRSLAAIDTAATNDNAVGPGTADETTGVAFARITCAMATRRTESNGGSRHRLSKSVRAKARDRRPGRYVAQTRRGPNRASSRRPWTASRFDLADLRNAAMISRSVLPAHRHGCDPERFVTRCNRHPVNPIGCRLGHCFGARPDGERSSGCRFDAKELPGALGYTELILTLKRLPKRGRLRGAGFCWRDRRALGCGIPRRGRPSALRHRGATVSSPFPFTPSHCFQTNRVRFRTSTVKTARCAAPAARLGASADRGHRPDPISTTRGRTACSPRTAYVRRHGPQGARRHPAGCSPVRCPLTTIH